MTESTAPQSEHRTVLLRGGDVHSPADPFATAMVVERGHAILPSLFRTPERK
ncbi:hypothetical protein [Streptomyces sp. NPDC001948]